MNRLTEADQAQRLKYLVEVLSDADRESRKPYIDDLATKANLTRSAAITWMIRRGYKPLGKRPKDDPKKSGPKKKPKVKVEETTNLNSEVYVHKMPQSERLLIREFFSDLLWASNLCHDKTGTGPDSNSIGQFFSAWIHTGGRKNCNKGPATLVRWLKTNPHRQQVELTKRI